MTAENLKSLMLEYNLNAKKIASLVHVGERTVYHWTKGDRSIPRLAWEHLLVRLSEKPAGPVMNLTDW